jgi:hypothetical protein
MNFSPLFVADLYWKYSSFTSGECARGEVVISNKETARR